MTSPRKPTLFHSMTITTDQPTHLKRKAPDITLKNIEIAFKHYPADTANAALLIHGGCFVKGDETWNADQAKSIAKNCNLNIFTLNFSKISLDASVKDIKDFFFALHEAYNGHVGLIGCSSGGFLTLKLLNEISAPQFVVLACPVMNPERRENMLLASSQRVHNKNIQKNQLSYFKSKPYPIADTTEVHLDIIAAKDDENVPLALISAEAKRYPNAKLHIVEGDHSRSFKPSFLVNEIISDVIYRASVQANESEKRPHKRARSASQ